MVHPLDQLQVPRPITQRRQGPHVRNSVGVAGEDEFALEPLVAGTFVESAACHAVLGRVANSLLQKQVAIKRVEQDAVALTEQYMSIDIADPGGLDRRLAGGLQHSDALIAIEAPNKDMTVRRG